MKVSREKFAENREKILSAASTLFRAKGFDGVGLADIMKAAGLTHGGFYGHFASKDDLAAAATRAAFDRSEKKWSQITAEAKHPLSDLIDNYLRPSHRDNPGTGCAMPSLGAETGRQGRNVREAFTAGLRPLLDILARTLPGSKAAQRRKALAAMSAMVGALVLSRAVDDAALSAEILAATAGDLKAFN
jgi:TetR/AcrR family transcriptional repressor of nem operon